MQQLQDWKINAPLPQFGLKMGGVSFGSRPKSKEAQFVVYWQRSPG
jgi:hypothetical protein